METLLPLRLPPGFKRSGTVYESKSRWYSGNLMRYHEGTWRPIGGWTITRTTAGGEVDVVGFPRGAHSWRTNAGNGYIIVGTTGADSRLYAYSGGVLTDITPAGLTDGSADGALFTGTGGWNGGGWGEGPWGGADPGGTFVDADTWQFDNFGETPVACLTSDGELYSWDLNTSNDAVAITNAPSNNLAVVVTPERFLMALGADNDPRLVQWASQETLTTWTPAAGNSAGDFPLQTNGRIVCGRRMARETLILTDADAWGAVFIGQPFVYRFEQRGDNCGIIGPNALAIAEGVAHWMGDGQFFAYDGAVRSIPCEVSDYVFGDLNKEQRAKVQAIPNAAFGEVTWYYPSVNQSGYENDRYVTLNYRQGFWVYGELDRAAGVGAGVFAKPMLFAPDGILYTHENGNDRGGEVAFLESGPLELGEGDRVVRVQKLIPDERVLGNVRASFYASFNPTETETEIGPYQMAGRTDVRVTGRQVRVRLEESIEPAVFADGSEDADGDVFATGDEGQDFRVGHFRVGVIPMGMR